MDKTERVTRQKTKRGDIQKRGIKPTALRLQTRGRHQNCQEEPGDKGLRVECKTAGASHGEHYLCYHYNIDDRHGSLLST